MLEYLGKLPSRLTRGDSAAAVLADFRSADNRDSIRDRLRQRFQSATVDRYIADNLDRSICDFARRIAADLAESQPIRGVSISDQVATYNAQFIGEQSRFIHDHISTDMPVAYSVHDGLPTARSTRAKYDMPADDLLNAWRDAPGRGVVAREDPQADEYGDSYGQHLSGYSISPSDQYQRADYISGGITFCDQSAFGMQNHVEQYENTSYKRALNTQGTHYDTAFGVSTPAADARLLERRIFRANEDGVENGIWRRDARLHRRNLDRTSEGFRGESAAAGTFRVEADVAGGVSPDELPVVELIGPEFDL